MRRDGSPHAIGNRTGSTNGHRPTPKEKEKKSNATHKGEPGGYTHRLHPCRGCPATRGPFERRRSRKCKDVLPPSAPCPPPPQPRGRCPEQIGQTEAKRGLVSAPPTNKRAARCVAPLRCAVRRVRGLPRARFQSAAGSSGRCDPEGPSVACLPQHTPCGRGGGGGDVVSNSILKVPHTHAHTRTHTHTFHHSPGIRSSSASRVCLTVSERRVRPDTAWIPLIEV